MGQSDNEMSGFLAELAGEATQKLEAQKAQQLDRHTIAHNVNAALERTFQFFNLFTKHLNALEPEVARIYALDGKAQFPRLKWGSGLVEYRKQSLADNALLDHVFFQVRLVAAEPVVVSRRWEQFEELRKDLQAYGLKTREDMHDLWRNRTPAITFQATLQPEVLSWLRFRGNYEDGRIYLECNNLDGFGKMLGSLQAEQLQSQVFDQLGRFLIGRTNALPNELGLRRDFTANF